MALGPFCEFLAHPTVATSNNIDKCPLIFRVAAFWSLKGSNSICKLPLPNTECKKFAIWKYDLQYNL